VWGCELGFGLSDLGALGLISFGEFLWSLLIIFFMIIFFIILFSIFADIFRSDDLGGWSKALWTIFIIVLPFLGILIYLIVRGKSMGERQLQQQVDAQKQFNDYVKEVGAGSSPSEQIAHAKELLDAGTIDQAEFDELKKKALAS
jgi:ABC-type multidrug transport system fused ATPase/permease subunit